MSTSSASAEPLSGPCAQARAEVDSRCAEAERLGLVAIAHQQRLREARRQLHEVSTLREADSKVRDRRQLGELKNAARKAYHAALMLAENAGQVQEAAQGWLREIDRLNRQVDLADRRAEDVVRRATELERAMPGIELAADAARITAEGAQVACLEARRTLADCEEAAQRRIEQPNDAAQPTTTFEEGTADQAVASQPAALRVRPITLVLRGDRETLLSLGLRLADETGVEAGRLQLLLLELREQLAARALEDNALRFPADHPFWSQFPGEGARRVVASLASMGYRFDGREGWADDHAPTMRELAIAVSHVGLDPRSLRRPAAQEALDSLWLGTTVAVEEYLASRAPDLDLEQVMAFLGPRGARLSQLWDMWGRLRPLLLTPA